MDSNIKASFIPDKIVSTSRIRGGRSSGGSIGDFFMLIAVVILVAALALAAGVFLYDKYLNASIQQKNSSLQKSYKVFEPSLVQKLLRVDDRINAATTLLNQHMAPSALFVLLEKLTLKSISYKSLNYSVETNGDIQIKMKGKAQSVNGVALQASIFGKYKAIIDPIFSNINIKNNGVTFEVNALLDPRFLDYQTVIQQEQAATTASQNSANTKQTGNVSTTSTSTTKSIFGGGQTGTSSPTKQSSTK